MLPGDKSQDNQRLIENNGTDNNIKLQLLWCVSKRGSKCVQTETNILIVFDWTSSFFNTEVHIVCFKETN